MDDHNTSNNCETILFCAKCGQPIKKVKARFSYLGNEFSHEVPGCPECGSVFISEDFANGKMIKIELLLEDK